MLKRVALNYAKWECAMAPLALIQHDNKYGKNYFLDIHLFGLAS